MHKRSLPWLQLDWLKLGNENMTLPSFSQLGEKGEVEDKDDENSRNMVVENSRKKEGIFFFNYEIFVLGN